MYAGTCMSGRPAYSQYVRELATYILYLSLSFYHVAYVLLQNCSLTHSLVWTCGMMMINDDVAWVKHCGKQWI